jgi:hypothetical protein
MPIDIVCPHCTKRFQVSDGFAGKRAKCRRCGGPIPVPIFEIHELADEGEPDVLELVEPQPAPQPATTAAPAGPVTCQVCHRGNLCRRKVHRMSGAALMIGYVLLIPSTLGVVLSLVLLAAPVLGFASAGGGATLGAILCFVFALLGWLLVMKKRVLQCDACQAIVLAS